MVTGSNVAKSQEGERKIFREGLHDLLAVIKADVALGETFMPEFDKDTEIDEATAGLGEIFELSGLDINAPGHWQLLLVAVLNCYTAPAPRVATRWTRENERLFVSRIIDEREAGSSFGVERLCEVLKSKFPTDYPAVAATLRTEFQRIAREMKARVEKGYDKDGADASLLRKFSEASCL